MTLRALYTVYSNPVSLEKVTDGLWIVAAAKATPSSQDPESDYFRSVDLFKNPMIKSSRKKVSQAQG